MAKCADAFLQTWQGCRAHVADWAFCFRFGCLYGGGHKRSQAPLSQQASTDQADALRLLALGKTVRMSAGP